MTVSPTVTIASLNLHCGLSGGGRPFDVATVLAKLDADIIAVQEDWWARDDGTDPAAEAAQARDAQLFRAELSSGRSLAELNIAPRSDRGTWGIAVLTRLPVLSHETLSLGQPEGELVGRAALICSVTAPGGWPLRLVCTHLSPRLNSPAQLVRLARHLATESRPTVIAGDLNMPRAATWMAAGYTPVLRGRTFPADRPRVQLDHLLAGPGLTCMAAEVLPAVGSDHLPVQGRFSPAVKPRLAVT
ncbi:MAG TPA: endonuclease/exonuclease/phosphatase family protein [Streptosporangiaceae bacterium]|nr:endonuclease/exonuclease/phosphatase family protein [Streptosporangiaceae bacterium]